jgi:hypothetical protein
VNGCRLTGDQPVVVSSPVAPKTTAIAWLDACEEPPNAVDRPRAWDAGSGVAPPDDGRRRVIATVAPVPARRRAS